MERHLGAVNDMAMFFVMLLPLTGVLTRSSIWRRAAFAGKAASSVDSLINESNGS